jgi:hypothetical protein
MSDKERQLKLTDLLGPGPSKVQKIHEHDEQQPDNVNNSKSAYETEYCVVLLLSALVSWLRVLL